MVTTPPFFFFLPMTLPITKDAIDPPNTKMNGTITRTYQLNVRDLASIVNAHIPRLYIIKIHYMYTV